MKGVEEAKGGGEGQRHGKEGDERGAGIAEKEPEDEGDHDGAVAEGVADVAEGMLDEISLLEEGGDFGGWGELGGNFFERGVEVASDFERIDSFGFDDAEDDAALSVDAGVAAHRFGAPANFRDLVEEDGALRGSFDGEIFDRFERNWLTDLAEEDFAAGLLGVSCAGGGGELGGGLFDLLVRNLERAHSLGVGNDVNLLNAAAHVGDFGDAGDGLEARANRPIGEEADLLRGEVWGAESEHHDLAHHRGFWREKRRYVGGERGEAEVFCENGAKARGIGAVIEFHETCGESDVGLAAEAGDAWDALEGDFDGLDDARFDFLGGKIFRLGEDGDGRFGEIGEDVHREILGE